MSAAGGVITHTAVDLDALRSASRHSLSTTPRSFLRWAGSKRSALPQLIEVLPERYRVYREPFLGSGALFFLLRPKHAVLSDSCRELISTFEAVRDHPVGVLRFLAPLKPDKERFYEIRGARSRGPAKRAAEFIYLNKTCWNGLYRVNGAGQFNVPYGAPKSDLIAEPENLRACSGALAQSGIELAVAPFDTALSGVGEGDLVFLDPPYVTTHNNNGFVDYNERLFSWDDQVKASEVAASAADAGAHVVVTNAYHDDVIALYKGFRTRELCRHSTLASDSSARGPVKEAILWRPGALS